MILDARPLIVDTVMPAFDASIAEHVIVRTAPAGTFRAARDLDFLSVRTPLLDAAMWARGLPARLTHQAAEPPPRLVLAQGDALPGWLILGENPGRELAFGAVGKFWQLNIEWRDVPIDEFAEFTEVGWGKIAADFSVLPYGEAATLLTYECRTRHHRCRVAPEVHALLVAHATVYCTHLPRHGAHHSRQRRRVIERMDDPLRNWSASRS